MVHVWDITQNKNSVNNAQNFLQSHFIKNRKFFHQIRTIFSLIVKFSVFHLITENRNFYVIVVDPWPRSPGIWPCLGPVPRKLRLFKYNLSSFGLN
jgi:hypothetical protein